MKSRIVLLFFALAVSVVFPLPAEEPRYSLDDLKTNDTTQALLEESQEMISRRESNLDTAESEDDEDEVDDLEDELEILEFVEEMLIGVSEDSTSSAEIFEANSYADRILQTVEDSVEGAYLPGAGKLAKNIGWGAIAGQKMPHLSQKRQTRPIGTRLASKESAYLMDNNTSHFVTAEEMAKLTPIEIASLQISPDHPIWYRLDAFESERNNAIATLESTIVDGMTGALHEDGDLEKDRRYPMHQARKVLFLEEIYSSATSPKGNAEDAFGVEWKVKWADEVAVEPIASRLYTLAGGKMTDLVFTNGFGPSDMILILRDPEDPKENKEDEHYPTTTEELIEAVDALYEFDLTPYIHSSGIISVDNVDSLLENLPDGGKKKYKKGKAIGREWVAFRESSSELSTKGYIRRHSGSRMSDLVAANDRVARGMYLFDMWVANRDAKDDNNKAFFLKEMQDGEMRISQYMEGHHDLGLSLGSMWSAGEINKFKVGETFARKGLFGNIRVKQAVIFRPRAWDTATWADCHWMAKHIGSITESQIREAVSYSNWPDFAQQAMAYRIISRQHRLSQLYGVEITSATVDPPGMSIPLTDRDAISAAERHYGLEANSLAKVVEKTGITKDIVLTNGTIADCETSPIVRLLIQQRYPSGLDTRYARKGKTPPKCLETVD